MIGVIKLNDLICSAFGHSPNDRIAVGLRDFPQFQDARLVGEVQRLHDIANQFTAIEIFGVSRWEGIYIDVPREDITTLISMYPDDEREDLEALISDQYSAPSYLLQFTLVRDGDIFSIRSESPYFAVLFDRAKQTFLVPCRVIAHDLSEEFRTITGEITSALQSTLEEALTNPHGYSARVRRNLPYENRIGRIRRADAIEAGLIEPTSLSAEQVAQFLKIAPTLAQKHPRNLSRDDYLQAVQVALGAIGKACEGDPLTKSYRDNADGRDGGMLRLAPQSKDDFYRWLTSRDWQGQHPFEIVRGFHSHTAIRLYATPHQEEGKIELRLCGAWEGVAEKTVRMALALHEAGIPVTLSDLEFHKARVLGDDWLLVSSSSGFAEEDWQDATFDNFSGIVGAQISYWELAEHSTALQRVAWNEPVIIQPLAK